MKNVVLVGLSVLLAGCGGASVGLPEFAANLTPVTGKVTQGDKPLVGATVTFIPDNGPGQRAYGTTDATGAYDLHTSMSGASFEETKGAVPGQYKVTVSQILMPDGSAIAAETTEADAMAIGATESLPPAYSSFEETILTATVAADQTESIDFSVSQ